MTETEFMFVSVTRMTFTELHLKHFKRSNLLSTRSVEYGHYITIFFLLITRKMFGLFTDHDIKKMKKRKKKEEE